VVEVPPRSKAVVVPIVLVVVGKVVVGAASVEARSSEVVDEPPKSKAVVVPIVEVVVGKSVEVVVVVGKTPRRANWVSKA
jgi:hypothetical protein